MAKATVKRFLVMLDPLKKVDLPRIVKMVAERDKMLPVDLNDEQLEAGREATGKEITPEYKPITVRIKKAKGQVADRTTLKDTGSFRQKIFAKFEKDRFVLNSRDTKVDELKAKYGEEIFGLTKQSKLFMAREMLPEVRKAIKDSLRIK